MRKLSRFPTRPHPFPFSFFRSCCSFTLLLPSLYFLPPSSPFQSPVCPHSNGSSMHASKTLADNIIIKGPYPAATPGNKRTTWRRLLSHKTKPPPPPHTSEIRCMSSELQMIVYLRGQSGEEGVRLAGEGETWQGGFVCGVSESSTPRN